MIPTTSGNFSHVPHASLMATNRNHLPPSFNFMYSIHSILPLTYFKCTLILTSFVLSNYSLNAWSIFLGNDHLPMYFYPYV